MAGGAHIISFHDTLFVKIDMDLIRGLSSTGAVHKQFILQVTFNSVEGAPIPAPVLSEVLRVDVEENAQNVSFSGESLIGAEKWNALSAEDQQIINSSLDFGEIENEKSRTLIQWLVNTYLSSSSTETHRMIYNSELNSWVGTAYAPEEGIDGFGGECKYWVDNDVVQKALSIDLPPNSDNFPAFSWDTDSSVKPIVSHMDGDLMDLVNRLQPGDLIQMANSETRYQHTIIVGKIDEDGLWIFDSNYGLDGTPKYHKISFESLNKYDQFTAYQII